jgi:hypothetical protein
MAVRPISTTFALQCATRHRPPAPAAAVSFRREHLLVVVRIEIASDHKAFLGISHALFAPRALFFARQTREPAGLLKKIRLGAIDGAITLRRWNMSLPILRVQFLKAAIAGFLTAYEEKDPCSQDASGKRFASEQR